MIRASARETDVVARFGGDEFALILPDTGSEGAVAVGDRVRDRIAAIRFLAADGLDIRLTVSVGVATLPDVAASADALIQAADEAMYRVKDTGRTGFRPPSLLPILKQSAVTGFIARRLHTTADCNRRLPTVDATRLRSFR